MTAHLREIEKAIRRALQAGGAKAREAYMTRDFRVARKPDGTSVTTADIDVQRIVTSELRAALPDVAIVAEESAPSPEFDAAGPFLAVDPIDGTTNFVRGIPLFSITCAYLEDGEALVGGVYDPIHDDYFRAIRGGGAFWNGRPIAPDPVRELPRADVSLPVDTLGDGDVRARVLGGIVPRVRKVRALRAAALEVCGVACGRLHAAVHGGVAVWDVAAATLIVEEAGGVWSSLEGSARFAERGRVTTVAAATPELHATLLDLLQPVKDVVACAVYRDAGRDEVLAVLRPEDDPDLPGIWGLPAASKKADELWEEVVARVGREKLGVSLAAGALLAEGEDRRAGRRIRMRVYEARCTDGEPRVPQPVTGVTQYRSWRWARAAELEPGARAGSLCCRLFLEAGRGPGRS